MIESQMSHALNRTEGAVQHGHGARFTRLQMMCQRSEVETSQIGDILVIVVSTTVTLLAASAQTSSRRLCSPAVVILTRCRWWDGIDYGFGVPGLVDSEAHHIRSVQGLPTDQSLATFTSTSRIGEGGIGARW